MFELIKKRFEKHEVKISCTTSEGDTAVLMTVQMLGFKYKYWTDWNWPTGPKSVYTMNLTSRQMKKFKEKLKETEEKLKKLKTEY